MTPRTDAGPVRDGRPPAAMVGAMNPLLRNALRSPLGAVMRPLALLEFTGPRSQRRFRVPVGWHLVDGQPVVFTPASWRVNFRGGAQVLVYRHGRRQRMIGTLDTDAEEVATAMRVVLGAGTPARLVGLLVPVGHEVTAADMTAQNRALVRFESAH